MSDSAGQVRRRSREYGNPGSVKLKTLCPRLRRKHSGAGSARGDDVGLPRPAVHFPERSMKDFGNERIIPAVAICGR